MSNDLIDEINFFTCVNYVCSFFLKQSFRISDELLPDFYSNLCNIITLEAKTFQTSEDLHNIQVSYNNLLFFQNELKKYKPDLTFKEYRLILAAIFIMWEWVCDTKITTYEELQKRSEENPLPSLYALLS